MFKTVNGGKLPTRATKYSACVDVYASEDVVVGAGETVLIGLGVAIDGEKLKGLSDDLFQRTYYQPIESIKGAVDVDEDLIFFENFMASHYLQLMLRSSLGKKGLILPNGVGIIDLDYRDEIKIIIHKPMTYFDVLLKVFTLGVVDISKTIQKGDRIGQITLLEHKSYLFCIDTEEERNGGFGSTDKNY